jgi:hypothetical protein
MIRAHLTVRQKISRNDVACPVVVEVHVRLRPVVKAQQGPVLDLDVVHEANARRDGEDQDQGNDGRRSGRAALLIECHRRGASP